MSLVDFLLKRPNAYKLRKEYDRLRERADRLHKIDRRLEVLRMLDQIEPSIISLEEHHMSSYDKKRIYQYIQPQLRKAKFMIDESKRALKQEGKEERSNLKDQEHDIK